MTSKRRKPRRRPPASASAGPDAGERQGVAPARTASAVPPITRNRRLSLAVALALAAATVIAYAPVRHLDFVDLDDPGYVYQNPNVTAGLTVRGVAWAFSTGHAANWHPLTWLSHMLDVELFGVSAGPHHLVNLGWHVSATMLLFGLLLRLTGAIGRSAFVAGLFALHPLHVESVAWVAERKDVLSTVLWFLTTWAYVAWVAPRSPSANRRLRVAVMLVLFALGLMAKPMLVTLPVTLLLVDVWPLGRISARAPARSWLPLAVEKVPLFLLAAISSVITFVAQRQGGAVSALDVVPWTTRLANAAVSYVAYLRKTIWPVDLAVFYPYPDRIAPMAVAGAAIALVAMTYLSIRLRHRLPYLFTGWLWYLATLLPVIGLIQVGTQSMADRYTYVPLVGIFVAVAWGAADALRGRASSMVAAGALAMVIAAAAGARAQVRHWRNSEALWQRAVDVTTGNYRAHNSLGAVLGNQGRTSEAIRHFEEALRLQPDASEAHHIHHNLGRALADSGRVGDSIPHYREALRIKPDFPEAHNNLGLALASLGRVDEAREHYERAVALAPGLAIAHNNLGLALYGLGKADEAIARYSEAIRLDPAYADAYNNRGFAHAVAGRAEPAMADFTAAITIRPGFEDARFNLALALTSASRYDEAREHLRILLQQHPAHELARRALEYVDQRQRARSGRGGRP
jgi:tetratricopeptide (TPR) repeat protein